MKKNKGLGVGALLSQINTNIEVDKKELVSQLSNTITEIPLENISTNPFQPRVEFDLEALSELSESISIHGLIQPITVRHLEGDNFQLISGERRMRASKMAGLTMVPAYVRLADDEAMLEMALIENIQRQDLNAIEVATTYERLMEELKLTHETLSKRVGKKRSTVTNYLRLLKLPGNIQSAIKSEEISMGHARAIVTVDDPSLQTVLYEAVLKNALSVRQVESYARAMGKVLTDVITGLKSKLINLGHVEVLATIADIVLQLTVYKEIVKGKLSPEEALKLVEQYGKTENTASSNKELQPKLPQAYQNVQNTLKSLLDAKINLKVDPKGKGQIIINFEDDEDLNRILDLIDK